MQQSWHVAVYVVRFAKKKKTHFAFSCRVLIFSSVSCLFVSKVLRENQLRCAFKICRVKPENVSAGQGCLSVVYQEQQSAS